VIKFLIVAMTLALLAIWTFLELLPYIEQNRHWRIRQKDMEK